MSDFGLKANCWKIDLVTSVCLGVLFASVMLNETYSGGEVPSTTEKVLWNSAAAASYVLAFVVGYPLSKIFRYIPSWIWLSVIGSFLFAFFNATVLFAVANWDPIRYPSTGDLLRDLAPYIRSKFFDILFLFGAYSILTLLGIRAVVSLFWSYYRLHGRHITQ